MKIWIVQAEHFNTPGNPITAHATEALAKGWAAGLVNLIITDANGTYDWKPEVPANATAETFEDCMAALHQRMIDEGMSNDIDDAQRETDVWIIDVELQTEPPALASAARDLPTRARIAGMARIAEWDAADLHKCGAAIGTPFEESTGMNIMRRAIIDTVGDWTEFCSTFGIAISPEAEAV